MDEKTIQRIKKLQALAERGVGGEKTTAQKKLAKLFKDNGINSLDELQKEEYEYTIFSYNGKHEIKLLRQCMYKVMGAKSDRTAYKPYGRRQKIGIYCTKAQKIEIELEFEFYRNVFYEELSIFMDAFIQAQKIFPEDAPVGDYDEFNEREVHFAWDRYEDKEKIVPQFKRFKEITQWDYRKLGVYVLCNFNTTFEQDLDRVYTLRELGYNPYVMLYEKDKLPAKHRLKLLQRWVNNRIIFRSCKRFEEYDGRK